MVKGIITRCLETACSVVLKLGENIVRTRPVSANTRLQVGHVAVIQEVLRGRKLSDVRETYLITADKADCDCQPKRLPPTAVRVRDFVGQRKGHAKKVVLPSAKTVRLKLMSIEEVLPDEDS